MRGMTTVTLAGALTLAAVAPAIAQQSNPCAAKKPEGRTMQNPCASKKPTEKNPCAAGARFDAARVPAAMRDPSNRDMLFGAGPTLRPPQSP